MVQVTEGSSYQGFELQRVWVTEGSSYRGLELPRARVTAGRFELLRV